MNSPLHKRLREGSVVLPAAEFEQYENAMAALASSTVTLQDQLSRVRLCFRLPLAEASVRRFDQQVEEAGIKIGARDAQLRGTIAAALLCARFGREPGRRRWKSLVPDTAAALAVRALSRAKEAPVHPDVTTWAGYWIELIARHQRRATRLVDPPVFRPSQPEVSDDEAPDEALRLALEKVVGELQAFSDDLVAYFGELDPAHIADQGEQLRLLWWLESSLDPGTAAETAAGAGRFLATTRPPRPPATTSLLRRRLDGFAEEAVALTDVRRAVGRSVPESMADLCPLLWHDGRPAPKVESAAVAAEWVLDELMLLRITSEAP